MQKITPFLWFDGQVEEAVNYYTSIFKNSKVHSMQRMGDSVFSAQFELEGQQFFALNGGPQFKFTEAISFYVNCEGGQEEIDYYWNRLIADGGQPSMCGWLKDKFGLSWQIIPAELPQLIQTEGGMQAMLKMQKIDLEALKEAAGK